MFEEAGQAARGAPPAPAHRVRPRDDAGARLLQRHRELLAHPRRPRRRAQPPFTLLDYFPADFLRVHRRVAQHGAADRRHVRRRPQRARRRSSSTASGCRRRSTTGRCASTSSCERVPQAIFVSATPGPYELRNSAQGGRADHPPDRPDRPRDRGAADARARSTTCWTRSARASAAGERVLVTTLTKKMAEDLDRLPASSRACARATCTPRSTPWSASRSCATCASASTTCWSASTCCARASTCPRCRWSRILDADKEGFLRGQTAR